MIWKTMIVLPLMLETVISWSLQMAEQLDNCPDFSEVRNRTRPGTCPKPSHPITCNTTKDFESTCDNDDRLCPENEKCCNNGCGLVCLPMVSIVKPGMCPTVSPTARCRKPGMARRPCASDENCPVNRKCCYNGCVMKCTSPIVEKQGMCPTVSPTARCRKQDMARRPCASDLNCPVNRKCCYNGCVMQCTSPIG
ncbi:hypothetical protein B566_EDAN009940 [Ephemera danica]|nr:hypothetical protein B566_EDAN009940 [Ephemera danica]